MTVKQVKVDEVSTLKAQLSARKNIFLTSYAGIKVKDLTELRHRLRAKNAEYKVVKNTLFRRALKENGYQEIDSFLKGPLGVAFVGPEIGEVAKVLKEFATENEKFVYSGGILDNVVYNQAQVKTIADLPPKEVVLAQVLGMINAPGSSIARGMNQIMASLARGIKAVGEKNG